MVIGKVMNFQPAPTMLPLLENDPNELYENAPCGYLSTLPDGSIIKVNATFLALTGYSRNYLLDKKRFQELLPLGGRVFYDTHFFPLLLMQGYAKEMAFDIVCAEGQRLPILLNATLKRDEQGNPLVIRAVLLDAQDSRAYEEELRLAKRKAEDAEEAVRHWNDSLEERVTQRTQERDRIWRMSQDILAVATVQGKLVSFNPAFGRLLGWPEEEAKALSILDLAHPEHLTGLREVLAKLAAGTPVNRFRIPCRQKDGDYRWISWTIMPEGELLYAVGRDINEEKKQAEVLRTTEEALQHAQKMEAIGKLTGGIAHDFNNILQVIAGNLELLRLELGRSPQADNRLKMAIASVGRGADLASQLLAFARRQALNAVPTDLGRILRDMDELLRRALGESIEVETIVGGGLWTAMVDRNQLENAILNLAINARDAMNGEGKLTLELGNAQLDDHYAHLHADVTPGQYVMLAVSDTGTGIAPDILEKIFEPFFTTKPEGEGTGLGLSMVYGFVKQSGGHIKVYSEIGHGTQFKIYLPRVLQAEVAATDDMRSLPVRGGHETILVVEDDVAVLTTVVDTLAGLGYQVLRARDGESALTILASGIAVDLLFTDVVMPGTVRSTDLAKQAKALLPDIEVLFTSGYTQNAIVHVGRLEPGVELLSKPYRREDLAKKVRLMLANKRRSCGSLVEKNPSSAPKPSVLLSSASKLESAGALNILVVEDGFEANQVLCEVLNYLGHTAQGVASGEEALQALAAQSFDVLLTDVRLPGMHGTDLAKQARAKHPTLKVIFSSGLGEFPFTEFDAYSLPKPYDLEQIKNVLAKLAAS
jgi:PAS domain S-box-containing protein